MLNIGLDIGYGYTKAVASNGKNYTIPSLIGEGFLRRYGDIFGSQEGLNLDNIHVELNGRHYFVGKLASLESRTCSYAFEKDRIEHENTKVLLATAVALLMNQEEESISIAVGLPFSDYIQQGKRFQEYLYNFDETVKLYDRNRPRLRRVRFLKATSFPQSAGAIYELAERFNFGHQGLVGCIDVGTKTTDIMVFTADKMYPVESMSGTIDAGAHIIHSYLQKEIEEQLGIWAEAFELESALRNNFQIVKRGQTIDLSQAAIQGKKDLAKKIRDEVVKLWGQRMDNLSMVFVVGGGALLLKKHLLKIYDNTIIPEGAEMLNARGFLHVARMMGEQWAGTREA